MSRAWPCVVGIVVAVAGSVTACRGMGAPVAVGGSSAVTIPREAANALRGKWAGAEPGRNDLGQCAGLPPAVPLVTGDFNGDGRADTALWVTEGENTHLAVLFARLGTEWLVTDVTGPSGESPSGRLEVIPRSTFVRTPAGQFDPFLGLDTIAMRQCDGSRTVWLYTGQGFRPQPLAD